MEGAAFFIVIISIVATFGADNPVIEFTMIEEVSSGYAVGSVANKSAEFLRTNKTDLVYNLMNQKSSEAQTLFSINDDTGDLYTIVKIDREHVCKEYDSVCRVTFDVGVSTKDRQFFQIVSVNVFIEDINDNAPLFGLDMYTLNVSEGTHIGYSHTIQQATDKDTGANNSVQSYELITDENSIGYFVLNVTKNLDQRFSVKLILTKLLDREKLDHFTLKVVAKDGGDPQMSGTLMINVRVLDTNDNVPEFVRKFYNKTIRDNTQPEQTVLTLEAIDKDQGQNAQIRYRLSEFQKDKDILDQLFHIVPETGDLKVKSDLTSVAGNSYQFVVEAVDQGQEPLSSQAQVTIHIQDYGNNAPSVSVGFLTPGNMGFVNISENDLNATFVAHVNVEDPDTGLNGEVDCQISSTHFAMVKIDKGYKVVVNAVLDRETVNSYNLTVTCTDKGTPVMSASTSFSVRITDYNDNKPLFSKQTYMAKLRENNVGNEMLVQVSATDADDGNNAIFTFQPHDDVRGRFIIDPNTGIIKANSIFDRETEPTVTFRVLAVDNGSPRLTGTATVSLVITDMNDNAPTFKKKVHAFSVLENQQTGTIVDTLEAEDLDEGVNAGFDFSVSADYINNVPFDVISHTGVVMATKQLDREARSRYDFVVVVTDRQDPSLSSMAHVTVKVDDMNDNAPIFNFPRPSNNSVAVAYPDYTNNYVAKIDAYDHDEGQNKELAFSIKSGNDQDIFHLDADTGVLTFKKQIDIGEPIIVSLDIEVKDKGDVPLYAVRTLFVELQYTNATFLPSTQEPVNSKYIIISVVVVVVTLVISGAIIGVILFLRTLDLKKNKKTGKDNSSTSTESDFGFSPCNPTHTILTADTLSSGSSEGHDLIKKKEVSFVLDTSDHYDYHQKQNLPITTTKDKPSKSSLRYSPQQFQTVDPSPNVLDTRELQNEANAQLQSMKLKQMMLQSRAKQWVEQQQKQYSPAVPHHDDHNSEGSAETIGSDSGRGCSEEDDIFSSPSADDPKLFDISSPDTQRVSGYLPSVKDLPPPLPCHQQPNYHKLSYVPKPTVLNSNRNYPPKSYVNQINNQLNLNRNLNTRHSVHLDSVSSSQTDSTNPRSSWSSAYYGPVMPMDYTGDSALYSFFDKTPVVYDMREEDETCSTTTSGSYTIYSEEIL